VVLHGCETWSLKLSGEKKEEKIEGVCEQGAENNILAKEG
jgi:hypothetical protein